MQILQVNPCGQRLSVTSSSTLDCYKAVSPQVLRGDIMTTDFLNKPENTAKRCINLCCGVCI